MREYGKVNTAFWESQTTRSMSEDGRFLSLYLLTSPHSTIAGVFRLPDGYICEDLQWSAERVSKGFAELLSKGFANRCEMTKWVWICKHFEFNPPENPNQRKSAAKIAALIPDECDWKPEFISDCGDFLGLKSEPLTNPSETVKQPFLNQKQEQEQEQKQEQEQEQESSPNQPIVDNSANDDALKTPEQICQALKRIGIKHCNPKDSELIDALKQGVKGSQIVAVASEPKSVGKGIRWVIATLRGRLRDAEANQRQPTASIGKQWFETASGIEEHGRQLGLTMKPGEQFSSFKSRVLEAARVPMASVRKAKLDTGLRP
jgi:hypothetical protein